MNESIKHPTPKRSIGAPAESKTNDRSHYNLSLTQRLEDEHHFQNLLDSQRRSHILKVGYPMDRNLKFTIPLKLSEQISKGFSA